MRILFALHGYKPAFRIGGPAVSVSSLAERLVRRGHEVCVVTTNSNLDQELDVPVNQPVDVEGVQVWYIRQNPLMRRAKRLTPFLSQSSDFYYAPGMKQRLRKLVPRADVVHTHCSFVYPTLAASSAARRFAKPYFYQQRGALGIEHLKYRPLKKRLYIRLVERRVMRSASALIALNGAEVKSYQALGLQRPLRIIPNGVELTAYRQVVDAASFEQRWNIPHTALVILFLGRLHPTKGADELLQAYLPLASRFPDSRLVMAGPDERGLQRRLWQMVQKAGAAGNIILPGMLTGSDKLDVLARADLFCLPSHAEGFSVAVLEALASRTPVLLTPGCHFPEVELAGVGQIVAQDISAISQALGELLANPAKLRAMGERTVDFVQANYRWDRIVDQLLDVYEQAIDNMRRPSGFRAVPINQANAA